MNFNQSPPHSRAENAHIGLKRGSMGEIRTIAKIFSRAGERQIKIMKINDSNPFYLFFLWLLS